MMTGVWCTGMRERRMKRRGKMEGHNGVLR